jgi:chorismate synthase
MLSRLKYLTAGESHGKGLLGIIDGIPAGLEISESYISAQLHRRQQGHGRGGRMKIETDFAELYTGVRHGSSLGSPIGLILKNKDWKNWTKKMSADPVEEKIRKVTLPRPGHADLTGVQKFDFDDIRNVLERSSARETAMRVALASVCRKLLKDVGIEIGSRVTQIHSIKDSTPIPEGISPEVLSERADQSSVRCLEKKAEQKMIDVIDKAKSDGDSVGGVFEIIATGLPYGLGSHTQWNRKLQARIAESILSVNAFKGIEIGMGFDQAGEFGSNVHDEIGYDGEKYIRHSNNAGGIEGGMSNAQPIVIRAVMKPLPTLIKPLRSVDIQTKEKKLAHKERTDSCAVPAASIVAESMLCFVLADALLEKFGGDSMGQLKAHMKVSAKY